MSSTDRPFGWRKRIGILSPTVIETAAYDFARLAPDGVSMCAITANIEHWSKENFQQHVIDPLISSAKYLASRNVDYIMHCGMPVVTTRGKGFEEEIVKIIGDATGLPASTSIRSAIHALAHLGIKNVAVLSPYPEELHRSALAQINLDLPGMRGRSSHNGCRFQTAARRHARADRASGREPSRIGRIGRRPLYPMQSVVRGRRCAFDRSQVWPTGGNRLARRSLGGVPLSRHRRSHRGTRALDRKPERNSGAGVLTAWAENGGMRWRPCTTGL